MWVPRALALRKRTPFPWAQAAKPSDVARWVLPGPELPIINTFSLAGGELSDQALVDRVPRSKIKIIQRLEHREPRALEAPLGGSLFAFDQLGALRQKIPVIAARRWRRAPPRPPIPAGWSAAGAFPSGALAVVGCFPPSRDDLLSPRAGPCDRPGRCGPR